MRHIFLAIALGLALVVVAASEVRAWPGVV